MVWYVGTLSDVEYDCPIRILNFDLGLFFGRGPLLIFWKVKSRIRTCCSRVPHSGVLFAVGELFVLSQARSACVFGRRRRVLVRPKAESFARARSALIKREAHVLLPAAGGF